MPCFSWLNDDDRPIVLDPSSELSLCDIKTWNLEFFFFKSQCNKCRTLVDSTHFGGGRVIWRVLNLTFINFKVVQCSHCPKCFMLYLNILHEFKKGWVELTLTTKILIFNLIFNFHVRQRKFIQISEKWYQVGEM